MCFDCGVKEVGKGERWESGEGGVIMKADKPWRHPLVCVKMTPSERTGRGTIPGNNEATIAESAR